MSVKSRTLQVEKVPETNDTETWKMFNERLNDLANQGFKVTFTTDKYILLRKKRAATRREE